MDETPTNDDDEMRMYADWLTQHCKNMGCICDVEIRFETSPERGRVTDVYACHDDYCPLCHGQGIVDLGKDG